MSQVEVVRGFTPISAGLVLEPAPALISAGSLVFEPGSADEWSAVTSRVEVLASAAGATIGEVICEGIADGEAAAFGRITLVVVAGQFDEGGGELAPVVLEAGRGAAEGPGRFGVSIVPDARARRIVADYTVRFFASSAPGPLTLGSLSVRVNDRLEV